MNSNDLPALDRRGILLIGTVLPVSLFLAVQTWPTDPITSQQWATWALFTGLTFIAQRMEVRVHRQTFSPNLLFLFAGVLLLPPFLFVLQVILPHLLEWAWMRWRDSELLQAWYVQPYNMATHILAGLAATHIHRLLEAYLPDYMSTALIPVSVAAVAYVLVNHLLIGEALWVTRAISWQESRLMDLDTLLPDLVLTMLGYVTAFLWVTSPWMVLPALTPLLLISQALQAPFLKQEADTDEKTGLLNSRSFRKQLAQEFERARRFRRPLSLIMADLDLLRQINNTYGHLAGDLVLERVAQIIRAGVREYDLACRFGGEEFAIALPGTSPTGAWAVAERIRQEVARTPILIPEPHGPIHVTISLGIAAYPLDAASVEELFHEADIALYYAKRHGRNRVAFVTEVPAVERLDRGASKPGSANGRHASGTEHPKDHDPEARGRGATQQQQPFLHPLVQPGLAVLLGTGLTALLLVLVGLVGDRPTVNGSTLALLALLSLLARLFHKPFLTIRGRQIASPSPVTVPLAILMAGLPGLMAAGTAQILGDLLQRRLSKSQALFALSVSLLAGFLPWQLYAAIPLPIIPATLTVWIPMVLVGGLLHYLVETGLWAGAIAVHGGPSFQNVWQRTFRPLLGYYLSSSFLALALTLVYQYLGLVGFLTLMIAGGVYYHIRLRYAHYQWQGSITAPPAVEDPNDATPSGPTRSEGSATEGWMVPASLHALLSRHSSTDTATPPKPWT